MKFQNPVISGFHPDPSICRVEEDFYLVTSSFEYFPGVPIFHSKDLINWKQIGHCLERESQLYLKNANSSGGIFAPTLRHHQGKFYMVTTNVSHQGNFFVWAENPEGPWSDPVWLTDWSSIDPSLFFDSDGTAYITGKGEGLDEERGIYQAKIDIETGKLLSKRRLIWKGIGGAEPEAPHLYKRGKYYYLVIAEGGTEFGHMVTVARARTPFGPFESYENNPILTHRSTNRPIQGTGHADLIQYTDGSWWAVFLGFRPIGYFPKHHLGREVFLAPVRWNKEGWPIIGSNSMVDSDMKAPSGSFRQENSWSEKENFTNPILNPKWNYRRNPVTSNYSLTKRKVWLTLSGSPYTLNDIDSHTFIGRRQEHFECTVSTLLEFNPNHQEEAGLTVFANEKFHYDVALVNTGEKKKVIFRKTVGSMHLIEKQIEYDYDSISFYVKADKFNYTFGFSLPKGESIKLGIGECSFLSKEVAGGFTGVYFGLYATGNGRKSTSEAYFDWFNYSID